MTSVNINYLLQLHQAGRISDVALDAALKANLSSTPSSKKSILVRQQVPASRQPPILVPSRPAPAPPPQPILVPSRPAPAPPRQPILVPSRLVPLPPATAPRRRKSAIPVPIPR